MRTFSSKTACGSNFKFITSKMSNFWSYTVESTIDYSNVWAASGGDLGFLGDNSNSPPNSMSLSPLDYMPGSSDVSPLTTFSNYRVAQENGQRIFGPPLDWLGSCPPDRDTEVFVGKIPRDCFETELIPLFERCGRIYKMRLMIDFSGLNRGYGFVQYFTKEEAKKAVQMYNGFSMRKNWRIGVMLSKNNNRLFFGNLPNNISRSDMMKEISKYTSGILNVVYYGGHHRQYGFGFVEYENHKQTALARRKFFPGSILLFGRQPKVDWAKSDEDYERKERSLKSSPIVASPPMYVLCNRQVRPSIFKVK